MSTPFPQPNTVDASTASKINDPPPKDTIDDYLPLSSIRDESRNELIDILENIRGRKCLIIDSELGGLLNQVITEGSKTLKESGVQYYRELKGDLSEVLNDFGRDIPENIIYLIRPHLPNMKLIAQQIKGFVRTGMRSQFKIFFVPNQSTVCMHLLEEFIADKEIWERISFREFKMGLIPFDTDLLSLEMSYVFKQCYVDGDLSCLNIITHALLKLQSQFGIIPNVRSKGVGARKILQRMMYRRVEDENKDGNQDNNQTNNTRCDIDTLVIMDREVDLISPLVTPLTYEGLVDETINIENGRIKVESSLLGSEENNELPPMKGLPNTPSQKTSTTNNKPTQNPGEKVVLALNNNDSIFAEIRNLSIERLGSYMQEKAIHIRERYAAFKGNKDASLAEIHDFVKKIPKLTKDFKSLNQHIHIAEILKKRTDSREFRDQWQSERSMLEGESILDTIEELLYSDVERKQVYMILRLLCLQSLTAGGIRASRYDVIRKIIVQVYGVVHLYTLQNFERSGLIKRKDTILDVQTTTLWQALRKQLRLIDDKMITEDINYVAAGYGPMMVRIIQWWIQAGSYTQHSGLNEALKLLPGPTLEFTQLSTKAEELSDALARSSLENGSSSTGSGSSMFEDMSMMNKFNSSFRSAPQPPTGDSNKQSSSSSMLPPPPPSSSSMSLTATNPSYIDHSLNEKKVMLVMVIGGLSFIEIAAYRHLSNDPNFPYKIILATTKLITGTTFLKSLQSS